MIKLPGLIDTHVHLREPGATQKEDFATGSRAAIAGGYTTILDMPNNPEPTVSIKALQKKICLAKPRIYSDVGFHFGATPDSIAFFQKVQKKVFGLKVYMNHTTGTLLIEDQKILERIFNSWPSHKIIMVHAEGETLEKAIFLAGKFKKKLHVCHLSLKDQLMMVKKAKNDGLAITCEVSAHHLFLTDKDLKKLGPFGMMRPPLSTKKDQDFLWKNIDYIDTIASDHAPHTIMEKQSIPSPNGVPGLETTLPLLLTAVSEKRLTIDNVIRLCHTNPSKIFNISTEKNTYIEVYITKPYTLNPKHFFTKCGWTPFEGMRVRGEVKRVILRGKTIFENGQFRGKPRGQIIYPSDTVSEYI